MMSSHDPSPNLAPRSEIPRGHRSGPSGLEAKIDAYAAALSEWLHAWYYAEEAQRAPAFIRSPRQRRLILGMSGIFSLVFALLIVLHRFAS